jgi:hypothetical protein
MKKIFLGLGVAAAVALAATSVWAIAPTIADTVVGIDRATQLKMEISQLEAKLQNLRKELASLQGQGNVWCYSFEQNLRIGDRTPGILELKEVLRLEGLYMQKDARTDFDEVLAASVTAFQEKYRDDILRPVGLSNGTGYVGKSTRAKLNLLYGCTRPPVSGSTIDVKTPATFTLTSNSTARVVNYRDMTITLKQITQNKIVCITAPCIPPHFALISVNVPGGCGVGADPRCLGAPEFHQDFNLSRGQMIDVQGLPISLIEISESKATFKIGKDDSTSNQPPVIKGVKGPSQLNMNETGMWVIDAYDPERASLRYSVLWGDEQNNISPSDVRGGSTNAQTTTFSHAYTKAGSYTVRFVVSDNAGQEARSTITVKVGEKFTNGSLYFRPDSLNLKVGETQGIAAYFQPAMPPCPAGMACAQAMPKPYRVDAKFTIENPAVISFQYAMPMCIQLETQDNYCGTHVIAEGKQAGVTTITATWEGLTASMPVTVSQ